MRNFLKSIFTKSLLSPASSQMSGGWFPIVRESFAGAWQNGTDIRQDIILSHWAVFACISLIASDIAKLRIKLVELNKGVWQEITTPDVLKKPNRWQTRQQFIERWLISKMSFGNVYVLLEKDLRGNAVAMYVLDPTRVIPLIAPDGSIFYQVQPDPLAGIPQNFPVLPESEIVHDRFNCLFHPLIGISPMYACSLAANQGIKIQTNSVKFFNNAARPSGILIAPQQISDVSAKNLKEYFENNFSGKDIGKIAVIGDGIKFEPMNMNAVDSQMVEQLKLTAEMVCSAFHVPGFKIGVGASPSYQSAEILDSIYYSTAIQQHIEAIEALLNEALKLSDNQGTEFDIDGLLRMDATAGVKAAADSVGAGIMSPNEARAKFSLSAVDGGDTPFLQQQYWPISSLVSRDIASTSAPIIPNSTPKPVKSLSDIEVEQIAERELIKILKEIR